jgi:hypothetical protein
MRTKLLLLAAFAAAILSAQTQPVLGEEAAKVSGNVWAIMGFPNIGIVVGNRATLVVDTGLGPANGATIARVVAKLAPGNQKLFLTTTHSHPEHAAGIAGFPRGTILIRNGGSKIDGSDSLYFTDMHGAPSASNPTMKTIAVDASSKETIRQELHRVNINQFTTYYDLGSPLEGNRKRVGMLNRGPQARLRCHPLSAAVAPFLAVSVTYSGSRFAMHSRAFSLTLGNSAAISSILQRRCAENLHHVESGRPRSGPVPAELGGAPARQRA